jgi:ubiquinone/menaquinone biosynthesis C-methylase UbiE
VSVKPPSPSAHTIGDFDARAATWDDDPTKVERARAIAAAISGAVPLSPSMSALEYGAGTGLLGFMLRERLGDLTLADVSEGMLEVAARKIEAAGDTRVRAVKLDLLAAPLPRERYDLVFSAMTLHHIPDTAGILRAFRSILRAPGYLCVADLDREDGTFHDDARDLFHLGFDRAEMEALLADAGFAELAATTATVVRKNGREYPIFLVTGTRRA